MALKIKCYIFLYKKERNQRKSTDHVYSKKHRVKGPAWRKCEKAKSSFCISQSHTGPSVIPSRGRPVALSAVGLSSFFIEFWSSRLT